MASTVEKLTKKRSEVVKKRIKTASEAARPAVTTAAKKVKKEATKALKKLGTEQKSITTQIANFLGFEKKAQANATPADKKRSAKPPGKRVSKAGKTYYENRTNRADSSRASHI